MRRKVIAGNWKMHKTLAEGNQLAEELRRRLADIQKTEVVLCPPFTSLYPISQILEGSNLRLGAQDMHWETQGAFTGEVSAEMLRGVGCQYVIIGHSERRKYFGETDETVNRKVKKALATGLTPIVCVGETLEERESGKTMEVVENQVYHCLEGLQTEQIRQVIIAYEPVWAIGTGRNATPEQAVEVHQFIRELIGRRFDGQTAAALRIQYGGSVTPENAPGLLRPDEIDGALVGGASLKADSFEQIVRTAELFSS